MKNKKQTLEFAVKKNEQGVVTNIGRSIMTQPTIKYDGRKTNWFDDSKLIKKDL